MRSEVMGGAGGQSCQITNPASLEEIRTPDIIILIAEPLEISEQ